MAGRAGPGGVVPGAQRIRRGGRAHDVRVSRARGWSTWRGEAAAGRRTSQIPRARKSCRDRWTWPGMASPIPVLSGTDLQAPLLASPPPFPTHVKKKDYFYYDLVPTG